MSLCLRTSQNLYPAAANNGMIHSATKTGHARKIRLANPCEPCPRRPGFAPSPPWSELSTSRMVRAKRFSRPVGSSGAKKRCGRSHDASSSRATFFTGEDGSMSIASGSRSSSSSSMSTSWLGDRAAAVLPLRVGDGGAPPVEEKDGIPKMGL